MFSYGIIGLPNVGKSTLFNALTRAGADVGSYPFCTIEPNVGVLPVPDERLERIGQVIEPETLTPAMMEFLDIAGLVRGASEGEGLGNEFLGHIQQVDAMAHVVRLFRDEDVAHVDGNLDPLRDVETINGELIIKDLEVARNRYEDIQHAAETGDGEAKKTASLLSAIIETLEEGRFVHEMDLGDDGLALVKDMGLLTQNPIIYIGNVSEDQIVQLADCTGPEELPGKAGEFGRFARENNLRVAWVCAQLESELGDLGDPEEARMFMQDMGIDESSISRLVKLGYEALGLVTMYTVKGPETRAWELPQGTVAPRAAGRIHSDMEEGFIKAEVIPWDKLVKAGSFREARSEGWMRAEGKDYVVKDGDVIQFHFQ
ncbi:MAG: redox-regulated ATPase YchF [Planctomycetota bacterium]